MSGSHWRRTLRRLAFGPGRENVDLALRNISDSMGIDHDTPHRSHRTAIIAHRAETIPRSMYYAPTMDGQAEPGEIVWIKTNGKAAGRAILVIGRTKTGLLGLLISADPEHASEHNWIDIGAGAWDSNGRNCWLRLDKIIEISECGIRRQGAIMPPHSFERISSRMRSDYGWS